MPLELDIPKATEQSMPLKYQSGFGNDFETEALVGALPVGQNSPQRCNYGLYAEQLSGTAFTAPKGVNERSWLYRIRPSVRHTGRFSEIEVPLWRTAPHVVEHGLPLGQLRWDPIPLPQEEQPFISGVRTMTTAGDAMTHIGMAAHVYSWNTDRAEEYFCNGDGELLFVPQHGAICLFTELGFIEVSPGEIAVVPRGIFFQISRASGESGVRGYFCENYGSRFTLPERGPIGANCLANPRDFKSPVAAFEDKEKPCRLIVKWCGRFYETKINQSPLDVVAWHGNYAPYKYDLSTFSPVGAILFDHPDPSIFTVLTAPSGDAGTANVDFVIFPPRWIVAEHTFRPPWYHRNVMSEFMGLICGTYDAKEHGFVPGGISLHNLMLPHGPDAFGFAKASSVELKPEKLSSTMAFMFETRYPQQITKFAAETELRQDHYLECWSGLPKLFDGTPGVKG